MIKLENTWFIDGMIDFEYKKYLLLAYLQSVEKNFTFNKLYPDLAELVNHYKNLDDFLNIKNAASGSFPKELKGIDLDRFVLKYEQMLNNDRVLDEIMKIIDYSLPVFRKYLEGGEGDI